MGIIAGADSRTISTSLAVNAQPKIKQGLSVFGFVSYIKGEIIHDAKFGSLAA
jgi:hypothetical protein